MKESDNLHKLIRTFPVYTHYLIHTAVLGLKCKDMLSIDSVASFLQIKTSQIMPTKLPRANPMIFFTGKENKKYKEVGM